MRKLSVLRALLGVGVAAFAVTSYVYVTLPDVRSLATKNPTSTAFMELRERAAERRGRRARHVHIWVPYSRISPHLKRAVLVAEDSAFWDHEGIDLEQIKASIEKAIERGGTIRGASTITQQLAKNLYLSPSRDPFRKVRELVITRRLEASLTKARILEIYLNVVEWGDGVWGAEAASRQYFGVPASALTRQQAALLAGALINPIVYSPGHPPRRLLRRQNIILARMGSVEPPVATATVTLPHEPAIDVPIEIQPEVTVEGSVPDEPAPPQPEELEESEESEAPVGEPPA